MTSGMLDSEPASLAEELEAAPAILHEEGILREEPEDDDRTASGLLDALVEATEARAEARHTDAEPGRLDRFLAERSPAQALYLWAGRNLLSRLKTRREIAQMLGRHIAHIDGMISEQLNAILHHPTFQRLESSWRGLEYLVDEADPEEGVKVKVLNVSWKELARDAERAVEFDQSQLFKKVYEGEFGHPGGEPFGVLIGDYELRHCPSEEHPIDDLDVLQSISGVAAAAFAPFVAAADPALFGVEGFSQLDRTQNVGAIFDQADYLRWRAFRDSEDARFVGLTVPRVLMRLPYEDDGSREDGFRFREDVAGPDQSKYLWGNASYAFGAVLIRSFIDSGWLAEIRGVSRDEETGGLVTGLPTHCFSTDSTGVALKSSTDLIITDHHEKELGELGFIPLCHCKDTDFSAFYGNQSVQKPKAYTELAASMNAKISSMLQYMLCTSRFAHYLKVRTQHKIGSFMSAQELESDLNRWVMEYVTPDLNASPDVKARYPLREAQVEVSERPDQPGNYRCIMRLMPHYQLDAVSATVTLRTGLGPGQST